MKIDHPSVLLEHAILMAAHRSRMPPTRTIQLTSLDEATRYMFTDGPRDSTMAAKRETLNELRRHFGLPVLMWDEHGAVVGAEVR